MSEVYKIGPERKACDPPLYNVVGPRSFYSHFMSHTEACILVRQLNKPIEDLEKAARRVRELEEALAAMVRVFESGWPSHATESIGGLGHMPGESCNACRMMRPYKDAQSALAGKERT